MLKRLVIGLVKGLVVGAGVAALLVFGLGITTLASALYAYPAAIVTGVLVGLVAGKPIWQKDARIEAGLKAVAGAVLAVLGMFAVRTWLHASLDLSMLKSGAGAIGELPAASLPLVATVLSMLFELDNTGDSAAPAEKAPPRARVADADEDSAIDEIDDDVAPRRARRKG